ncbi:hypothetical protein CHUAL_012006 [Chamberlinius hualienensis]
MVQSIVKMNFLRYLCVIMILLIIGEVETNPGHNDKLDPFKPSGLINHSPLNKNNGNGNVDIKKGRNAGSQDIVEMPCITKTPMSTTLHPSKVRKMTDISPVDIERENELSLTLNDIMHAIQEQNKKSDITQQLVISLGEQISKNMNEMEDRLNVKICTIENKNAKLKNNINILIEQIAHYDKKLSLMEKVIDQCEIKNSAGSLLLHNFPIKKDMIAEIIECFQITLGYQLMATNIKDCH